MSFDTDILVWILRRHPNAIEFADSVPAGERNLSAIFRLELLYGCRDAAERERLDDLLANQFTGVISVSEGVSGEAQRLMERYALLRRPGPSDVLIAATAVQRDESVATGNRKRFEFVRGLELKVFRP